MRAFLSYSSADRTVATTIFRTLRDQAVVMWFDELELYPGDSLIDRIADGITKADYLLVLVTDNSKQSPWVQKELSIALTQELTGDGPIVIPLLLDGCKVPTVVADKVYVTIGAEAQGVSEVIRTIFRDSYILNISLGSEDLRCDVAALHNDLYEFTRQHHRRALKVRINNYDFNHRVASIAEQAARLQGIAEGLVAQIKRQSESFHLELPIYWVNLADLLTRLLVELFAHYGRNLDGVKASAKACRLAMDFAQFIMYSRIRSAVFGSHAIQFGHPDVAAYVSRFSSIVGHGRQQEELVRTICEFREDRDLAYVDIVGNRERRIVDQKIYLPVGDSPADKDDLRMGYAAKDVIPSFYWYEVCAPQILGRFLQWTSFREGKPLHELEYNVGFSRDDYSRIGYA